MTYTLISTAAAVSLILLAVLALRGTVARQFGARAAYALWLAPLLRAVWPLVPSFDLGSIAPMGVGPSNALLVISRAPSFATQDWAPTLLAIWVSGAVGYLAFQIVRHQRFLSRAMARGTSLAPRGVPYDVIASDCVEGPAATGLIHPIILVPADFAERFTPAQQRLALLHEQLHHRRGDIWASAAALLVTAALWFNPFAHIALGAFRRDMEAACDRSVLARSKPAEATAYAETILRCAARPVPRSLCALTSIDELKGRLTMLTLHHSPVRRVSGLIIASVICLSGLALSGRAMADQPQTTEIVEKKIIRHGTGGNEDFTKRIEPGDVESLANECKGEKVEIAADGGSPDRKQAIKLFICGDKGAGAAGLAEALSNALGRIDEDNKDLDPATKAEMKAKIESKIRELRAKG